MPVIVAFASTSPGNLKKQSNSVAAPPEKFSSCIGNERRKPPIIWRGGGVLAWSGLVVMPLPVLYLAPYIPVSGYEGDPCWDPFDVTISAAGNKNKLFSGTNFHSPARARPVIVYCREKVWLMRLLGVLTFLLRCLWNKKKLCAKRRKVNKCRFIL